MAKGSKKFDQAVPSRIPAGKEIPWADLELAAAQSGKEYDAARARSLAHPPGDSKKPGSDRPRREDRGKASGEKMEPVGAGKTAPPAAVKPNDRPEPIYGVIEVKGKVVGAGEPQPQETAEPVVKPAVEVKPVVAPPLPKIASPEGRTVSGDARDDDKLKKRALQEVAQKYQARQEQAVDPAVLALQIKAVKEYFERKPKDRLAHQEAYSGVEKWFAQNAPRKFLDQFGKNLTASERIAWSNIIVDRHQYLKDARERARQAGATEAEIAAVMGEKEPVAVEAALEQPPKDPAQLKKWLGLRLVGRMAFEALTSVLAVNAPRVTEQYVQDKKARGKSTGEVYEIIRTLSAEITPEMRQAVQEGAFMMPVSIKLREKYEALNAKVDKLVQEGRIAEKRRDQILEELAVVLTNHTKAVNIAQGELARNSHKVLDDYLEKKVSKMAVSKEWLNTGLVATQQYLARGIVMLGLTTLDNTLQKKREYELDLRVQILRTGVEAAPGVLEKIWEVGAKRVIGESITEFTRSLAFQGATAQRKKQGWWVRSVDATRSVLTIAKWLAIASSAHSEMTDRAISGSVANFLEQWQEKGPGALLAGFTRNAERIFHLTPAGPRGQETLKAYSEIHPSKVEAAVPAPESAAVERLETPVEFLDKHGVIKSLVEAQKASLNGQHLTINLGDREHGFAEVQQALRRVVLQDLKISGDHLNHDEMNRAEKIIKLLTHSLHQERLHAQWFHEMTQDQIDAVLSSAHGVVHLDDQGDLVIEDLDKFSKMMPKLENMADHYDVSMMAYLNNTRHKILQDIVDQRFHGTSNQVIVDDFAHDKVVHQAEIKVAQYEVKTLGIPGAQMADVDVVDEHNYVVHVGGDKIRVNHGEVIAILTTRNGVHYDDHLPEPIKVNHAYAGDAIKRAMARIHTEVASQGMDGGGAERVAPAVSEPSNAGELARLSSAGGIKGPDGKLHFGEFAINEGWFIEWDDMSIKDFMADAPWRFSPERWFSAQAEAHYKLACVMAIHKADSKMSVGQWTVENHRKIGEWVR